MPSTGWPSITEKAVARAYWLGRTGYLEAAALQHALVEARKRDEIPDTFLFLEHPPVITLGRASRAEHVLAPDAVLQGRGIEVWETTRGGDVTYHGPGQLVGYPVGPLAATPAGGRDVVAHVRRIEAALIEALATFGITGARVDGRSGVWVGN
jgi:lipoyl(octanoyl) transferase